ncbi:MAG: hypothetical protein HYR91_13600, partial [Flavobacteriia bacterium]|nr:hypothetical protein [Flavobacteriia bacterium]
CNFMTNILKKIFSQESKVDIYELISKDDIDALEEHLKNKGNPNQLDEYGQTPIYRVLFNKSPNQFEMLKCLYNYGADINYKREDGTTPIFYARGQNANFLVEKGALLNQVSIHGTTPLFNCFDPDTVNYFVTVGLDINAKDKNGRAPLHDYVYFGSQLVETAIKNKADVNVLTADEQTPLICLAMTEGASKDDFPEMILTAKKLLENKAIVNHQDKMGHDVYYYCNENQNQELAEWLRKNST